MLGERKAVLKQMPRAGDLIDVVNVDQHIERFLAWIRLPFPWLHVVHHRLDDGRALADNILEVRSFALVEWPILQTPVL